MKAILNKRTSIIAVAIVLFLVGGVWLIKRSVGEPSYDGRTVTEWLESLRFYTYETNSEGITGKLRSPEAIAADPAVRALSAIGPRAVPVLVQCISEPGEMPATMPRLDRLKHRLRWKLLSQPGPQGGWTELQRTRKTAAGFALLAVGTKEHGGFSRFMEAYAGAPQFTSVAGGKLSGMPVGVSSWSVVSAANAGLPERRLEISAEVMAALEHTNALYRQSALEAATVFPSDLLKRKELLLKLTLDESEYVKAAALGNLMRIALNPALRELMSLTEIRKAAEAVLEAPNTSERNQDTARNVIRIADKQAAK